MSKSALLIRNISTLSLDDIAKIIELSGPNVVDEKASQPVQELQEKIQKHEQIPSELMRKKEVRDYLYEKIKATTKGEIHLILHLDESKETGTSKYITDKLAEIHQDQHVNLFYLGGGHGGGYGGKVDEETSGLKKATITNIVKTLESKNFTTAAVICGSCYSGAFTNDFRPFLIPQGVMLSDLVECGNSNFLETVSFIRSDKDFFSADQIKEAGVRKASDLRTSFLEITGARVDNSELDDFDQEIKSYSDAIKKLGINPGVDQLKEITNDFVKIKACIDKPLAVMEDKLPSFLEKVDENFEAFKKANSHLETVEAFEKANSYLEAVNKDFEACKKANSDADLDAFLKYLEASSDLQEVHGKNFLKIFEFYLRNVASFEGTQKLKDIDIKKLEEEFKAYLSDADLDVFLKHLEASSDFQEDHGKNFLKIFKFYLKDVASFEGTQKLKDIGIKGLEEEFKAYLSDADLDVFLKHLEASSDLQEDHSKNFLKIFKFYLKDIVYSEGTDKLKDINIKELGEEFEAYFKNNYNPEQGPQIKKFASEQDFYAQIAISVREDIVTSKVHSSPEESQLMELSSTTGKPAHACDDAYERSKKTIELIEADPKVTVVKETDVGTFNQASIMHDFNESIQEAMQASIIKIQSKIKAELPHEPPKLSKVESDESDNVIAKPGE